MSAPIDRLQGTDGIRRPVLPSTDERVSGLTPLEAFLQKRQPYIQYPQETPNREGKRHVLFAPLVLSFQECRNRFLSRMTMVLERKPSYLGCIFLLLLRSARSQTPTFAPTSSLYPTSTPWPTFSNFPTSTSYPTSTSFPTQNQRSRPIRPIAELSSQYHSHVVC